MVRGIPEWNYVFDFSSSLAASIKIFQLILGLFITLCSVLTWPSNTRTCGRSEENFVRLKGT
jgi:hypothetical protein